MQLSHTSILYSHKILHILKTESFVQYIHKIRAQFRGVLVVEPRVLNG